MLLSLWGDGDTALPLVQTGEGGTGRPLSDLLLIDGRAALSHEGRGHSEARLSSLLLEHELFEKPDSGSCFEIYTSSVAVTGTWSDGRAALRYSLATVTAETRSASLFDVQMWSSRRPLFESVQSGDR
jgi:hypothetical protein